MDLSSAIRNHVERHLILSAQKMSFKDYILQQQRQLDSPKSCGSHDPQQMLN